MKHPKSCHPQVFHSLPRVHSSGTLGFSSKHVRLWGPCLGGYAWPVYWVLISNSLYQFIVIPK